MMRACHTGAPKVRDRMDFCGASRTDQHLNAEPLALTLRQCHVVDTSDVQPLNQRNAWNVASALTCLTISRYECGRRNVPVMRAGRLNEVIGGEVPDCDVEALVLLLRFRRAGLRGRIDHVMRRRFPVRGLLGPLRRDSKPELR
jgi:hypothetical protein